MPVPFLVPLLGSMAGSLAAGAGIFGTAAAATGAGSLIASAAPSAIGSGIATLLAGGDFGEAATNALTAGIGSAAMPGVTSAVKGVGAEMAGIAPDPLTTLAKDSYQQTLLKAPLAESGILSNVSGNDLMKAVQAVGGPQERPQMQPMAPAQAPAQPIGGRSSFGTIGQPAPAPAQPLQPPGSQPQPQIASVQRTSYMPQLPGIQMPRFA